MKTYWKHAFLVYVALLIMSCGKDSFEGSEILESPNNVAMEQELLGEVNEYRASLGYPVLQYSPVAYEYANKHTDYMISKGELNHDNFSTRASSISAKVNAESVAENVAKDYNSASGAFQSWLNSSAHKKTMEGEFTHTAVSVKKDGNGIFYYTQLFFESN